MASVSYAGHVQFFWFVVTVTLTLALASGCRDPELSQLEKIKDEVCACKTTSCGEIALKRVPQNQAAPNHRSQKIAKELIDCLSKLHAAEAAPPDPEEPASDPETANP